jgi:hypothetical protein
LEGAGNFLGENDALNNPQHQHSDDAKDDGLVALRVPASQESHDGNANHERPHDADEVVRLSAHINAGAVEGRHDFREHLGWSDVGEQSQHQMRQSHQRQQNFERGIFAHNASSFLYPVVGLVIAAAPTGWCIGRTGPVVAAPVLQCNPNFIPCFLNTSLRKMGL